jgi:predicted nucleic acid-binding protein
LRLYLETSAALRDILEGEGGVQVRALLRRAELVVTSRLTLAEVGRVLARMRLADPELAARVAAREAEFLRDSELWAIHPVDEPIWDRCARPFPVEPVRTMDAVHLATIETLLGPLGPLTVVSTDDRVRSNAAAMRLRLAP